VEQHAGGGDRQRAHEGPAVGGAEAEHGVHAAVRGGQQAAGAVVVVRDRVAHRLARAMATIEAVGVALVALEQAQRRVLVGGVGRVAEGGRQPGAARGRQGPPVARVAGRRGDRCQRVAHVEAETRTRSAAGKKVGGLAGAPKKGRDEHKPGPVRPRSPGRRRGARAARAPGRPAVPPGLGRRAAAPRDRGDDGADRGAPGQPARAGARARRGGAGHGVGVRREQPALDLSRRTACTARRSRA
jgi:hypothetical protein